ncbi:MAG TPA: hypothetical protein PK733_18855, partial [Clostridiales bacterium]|nr:hypothetical protein [Clostridiales bacterium]
GHGNYGIYALLAAAIDERIERVKTENGLTSFSQLVENRYYKPDDIVSIMLPEVLKYFDLPELRTWVK